jgi:hypothetical protein
VSDRQSATLSKAVEQVLAQIDGPTTVRELCDQVLAIRPSKARNPLDSLRAHLRSNQAGSTLVFLDGQTIVPLHLAMLRVRFRVPLSRQEVSRGVLFIQPAFDYFLRRGLEPSMARLEDQAGRPLPVRLASIREQANTPFGSRNLERTGFDLGAWFQAQHVRRDDSILVTIQDWIAGTFRLEHESSKRRRNQEMAQKDQELADVLYGMLEAAQKKVLYTHVAIATAYARLSDPRGYPGNHWIDVIERDPRMAFDGWTIRYSDDRSPLQQMLGGTETPAEAAFSPAAGKKVYHFKAVLQYRPDLWRTIQIQGQQSLAEFDAVLREAFERDVFDHLGGFWKLVRRGQTKRFREVDLGTVDPIGEGDGAGRHVAGLELSPGDKLKYVYDFGDWIEHRITLEEIAEPEPGVAYPRIVSRSPPHYQDCESCLAEGRRLRATWCCLQCSQEQQREILICEECMLKRHEGHYVEEILY